MNKAVVAYIILFAFVIILIVVFLPRTFFPQVTTSTTSVAQNTTAATTTSQSNTTSASTTSIPNYNYTGCIVGTPTYPIANGYFTSFTNTSIADWNTTPKGFTIYNITDMNRNGSYYDAPWSGTNNTVFASTYDIGTVVRNGNLTSSPFAVVLPYMNFQIISAADKLDYVAILRNGSVAEKIYFNSYQVPNNTNAESHFENASVNLIPFLCQRIQVRLVSGVSGSLKNINQYMAVTNFYLSKTPRQAPNITVNETMV